MAVRPFARRVSFAITPAARTPPLVNSSRSTLTRGESRRIANHCPFRLITTDRAPAIVNSAFPSRHTCQPSSTRTSAHTPFPLRASNDTRPPLPDSIAVRIPPPSRHVHTRVTGASVVGRPEK